MLKWIVGIIGGTISTVDSSAASKFVGGARRKIREEKNGNKIAFAFAEGLDFMIKNLMGHLQVDREKALSARGFDNDTLDRVYRYALGGAEKANPMLKAPSATAQHEGLKMSFGCLAISHLYRLRFLETQVSGEKLQIVQSARREVQTLMRDLLTFSIPESPT